MILTNFSNILIYVTIHDWNNIFCVYFALQKEYSESTQNWELNIQIIPKSITIIHFNNIFNKLFIKTKLLIYDIDNIEICTIYFLKKNNLRVPILMFYLIFVYLLF